MGRTLRSIVFCAIGLVAALGANLSAQDAILTFTLGEQPTAVPQGGEAIVLLRVENASVYPADDIEPVFEAEGIAVVIEPESIGILEPFSSSTFALRLGADASIPLGDQAHVVSVFYTYCIGDLCFQIVEELSLDLSIVTPPEVPVELAPVVAEIEEPASRFGWELGAIGLGLVLLAASFAVRRRTRNVPATVVLGLFVLGGLGYGVVLNQHEQAQGIGAVLCTSCVGIEVAQHGDPELTAAGRERIEAIDREIELLVFTAEWCHACPYAKAMVELIADTNLRITFRIVDVDEEPELAEDSGVIRSGRTVVPATQRRDTGGIVFGAEHLERKLLDLLEEDA